MDILTKWKPILDVLKVTDEKRLFIAEYAEHHMKLDSEASTIFETKSMDQNLLPISLKVLSELKLDGKNVEIKMGMPTKSFSMLLNENDGILNPNYIEEIGENTLLHLLIDYLNEELETKNNLYITTMVNSISLISCDGMKPKMTLTSRCHVE